MGVLDLDRRGLARMADAIGNSFLIASLAVAGDLAREGEPGTTLSTLPMAFGLGVAIGPLALVVVSTQVAETGDLAGAPQPRAARPRVRSTRDASNGGVNNRQI